MLVWGIVVRRTPACKTTTSLVSPSLIPFFSDSAPSVPRLYGKYTRSIEPVPRLRGSSLALTNLTFPPIPFFPLVGKRRRLLDHESSRPPRKIPSLHRLFPMMSYTGLSATTVNPFSVVPSAPVYSGVRSLRIFLVSGSYAAGKVIGKCNDLIVSPLSTVYRHQGAIAQDLPDFCILLRCVISLHLPIPLDSPRCYFRSPTSWSFPPP